MLLTLRNTALTSSCGLALSGLLTGCAALLPAQFQPAITIRATEPAEIFLVPAARQVAVISRYDAAQLPYSKERKVEVMRAGAAQAVDAALRQLTAEPSFRATRHDTLVQAAAGEAPPLPAATVRALCRRWNVPSLLALEGFEASMRQDQVVKEKSSDGSTSKTAAYSVVVRTQWTLYDAQGQVLNHSGTEAARPYQQRTVMSGLLAAGPALAAAGDAVQELAQQAGTQYARRYTPTQLTLERDYYTSRGLEAATAALEQRDWPAALAPLQKLAATSDTKLASRAAYNLSVVYEALDNLEEALRWATKAEQQAPTDRHAHRVLALRQRQQAAAIWEAQQVATGAVEP